MSQIDISDTIPDHIGRQVQHALPANNNFYIENYESLKDYVSKKCLTAQNWFMRDYSDSFIIIFEEPSAPYKRYLSISFDNQKNAKFFTSDGQNNYIFYGFFAKPYLITKGQEIDNIFNFVRENYQIFDKDNETRDQDLDSIEESLMNKITEINKLKNNSIMKGKYKKSDFHDLDN